MVSPMRTEMLGLIHFLHAAPDSAFAFPTARRQLLVLANNGGRVALPAGANVDTAKAKAVIEIGVDIYNEFLNQCNTLISDPAARAGAISRANAVLNDLALLYASQEDV
jgi:hypothetical protein